MSRVLSTTAALTMSLASSVFASEDWGTSGDWAIRVDPDAGNGCFAERTFDDGTVVQIGAVPARQGGFFAAYNPSWTDIQDGAVGTVLFDFGDEKFGGEVVGRVTGDLHGGYAFFDNPNFVTEFAGRYSVKVSGESDRLVEIDLKGSKRAIDTVLECQKEQPVAPPSE